MMRILILALTWGLLAGTAMADSVSPPDSTAYQFDNENSSMTIYGSSNVRDWTMDVSRINGTVALGAAEAELPSIQTVRAEMPVQYIVSDKDRLQRHAHEALKKEEHPTISFVSSDVQVAAAAADSFAVTANGTLTIAGETHSITLTATGAQQQNGTLTITGHHELKLSTFDVERPSLMFGAIKTDDEVRIDFNVILIPTSQVSAAE